MCASVCVCFPKCISVFLCVCVLVCVYLHVGGTVCECVVDD